MKIGIDLGVRSLHISEPERCFTIKSVEDARSNQLNQLSRYLRALYGDADVYAYVEEPVVAGARNLRTSLMMAQVAGMVLSVLPGEFVPVSLWKKRVVGKGNATKGDVARWLGDNENAAYRTTHSQDHIDACCIRLYGERHAT